MNYLPEELIQKIHFYSIGPYYVETYNLKKKVNLYIDLIQNSPLRKYE